MAGHSKWAKIKHQKAINDNKKGKVFSKYGQQIAIAARDGGPDLSSNFTLRLLVEKAKSESMPAANIQRAIDRGSGKGGEKDIIEEITYEGYGPAGVSVMVDVVTDNKNRSVSEIRKLFSDNGGNMGDSGSVAWNFERKGLIIAIAGKWNEPEKFGAARTFEPIDSEQAEMSLMEVADILDIHDIEFEANLDGETKQVKGFEILTPVQSLAKVRDEINGLGYIIDSAQLVWDPKMPKDISDEDKAKVESFVEALEEYDDVQEVFTDLK